MTVYFLYLTVVILVGWYLQGNTATQRTKAVSLGVTALVCVALMTLRYAIGYDYFSYEGIFKEVAALPMGQVIAAHQTEPVFYILTKLVSMVTTNYHVFLLVCNLIMVGCVFWVIYRYSASWWLSSMLFLTLQFLPHCMNLLRQSMAACILFAGWGFLKKGKFIPYALVVLLASAFHISAIVMIPAYFLLRLPLSGKVLAVYGGLTLVAYAGFRPIVTFATTYLFPKYANYIDSAIYGSANSFTYVLLPIFLLAAALLGAKMLLARDKSNSILIYTAFFTFVCYLFMTRMYLLERFSIYFFMYAMLLLPEIIAMLEPTPIPEKASAAVKKAYKGQRENQLIAIILTVAVSIGYLLFAANAGFHKTYPYVSVFDKQNAVDNNTYFQNH